MPERSGDVPIDERVNAGEADLTTFFPGGETGTVDAHDAINNRSPYRTGAREGKHIRRPHQSTRRDISYAGTVKIPDYVISQRIEIGGRAWDYQVPIGNNGVGVRRVFIERNQAIELEIDETLAWLSAGKPGMQNYEETRAQLEAEADLDNINNRVIMQHMYARIKEGKPMLPNSSKVPKTK
jgi:hypothetical protein